jgi:2-isopropylmalate synthase
MAMKPKPPRTVDVYDTTLRDGSQTTGVNFSLQDKIDITLKLDEIGIHYIEGGSPPSNPKDMEYFQRIGDYDLSARVAAFGSTMHKDSAPDSDQGLRAILDSGTECATIFGKSWGFHVKTVLRTSERRNLEMIEESVRYLREQGLEVIFDAEHFYDGYKANPEYALSTIEAAERGGAQVMVLCDTNGGCLPGEVGEITAKAGEAVSTKLGFHGHNDSGCAVANTIESVLSGAQHVQGTINGIGERCGNTDLCVLLPNIEHKLKVGTVMRDRRREERLFKLKEASEYLYEIMNMRRDLHQPYVGDLAFSHKGGMHADAVSKHPHSYEHIDPALVGNARSMSVSELSGKASIVSKAKEFGFDLDKSDERTASILRRVKSMEARGYHLLNADATVYLLMSEEMGILRETFDVLEWRTLSSTDREGKGFSEATVKVKVGEEIIHTIAEGDGPVNAQDLALRKALRPFFPQIEAVELINYKVTVINMEGTASAVEVFVEFDADSKRWSTVGVSENVLEASKIALVHGYRYFLQLNGNQ